MVGASRSGSQEDGSQEEPPLKEHAQRMQGNESKQDQDRWIDRQAPIMRTSPPITHTQEDAPLPHLHAPWSEGGVGGEARSRRRLTRGGEPRDSAADSPLRCS